MLTLKPVKILTIKYHDQITIKTSRKVNGSVHFLKKKKIINYHPFVESVALRLGP